MLKINVLEVKIAYAKKLPTSIIEELEEVNATMYDDNGGGQYPLDTIRDRFDEDAEEYKALDRLIEKGYDYLEYS